MCGENYVGEFGRNVVLRWEDHEDINKQAELGKNLKIFPDRSSRSEVFLVECVLKICSKFTGEHPCRSVISIKFQSNFIQITLRHGCSPVFLLHIFRTPFTKDTL